MRTFFLSLFYLFVFGGIAGTPGTSNAATPSPRACTAGLSPDLRPDPGSAVAVAILTLPAMSADENGVHIATKLGTGYLKIWRIACGNGRSALLGRIEDLVPNGTLTPVFPKFFAVTSQASRELLAYRLDTGARLLPGAFRGTTDTFALIPDYSDGSVYGELDFENNITVHVENAFGPTAATLSGTVVMLSNFLPVSSTYSYPDAFGPRPINGRYAGNFFDPQRPGEGIVVEIGDVAGQPGVHFLQFAWHSFDNQGAPFWISGGTGFSGTPKQLHMPAAYRSGGRFGGAAAAQVQTPWGSVDIEFSDCHTAVIHYAALSGLPVNVPSGSRQLQWQRLTGISGYSCD
ncbi:MAG: hypothetical protein ABI411_12565 [Tahibacter sp.]